MPSGLLSMVLLVGALAAPAGHADPGPARDQRFLVLLDGVHVGTARWRWGEGAASGYVEDQTIRIKQRVGAGRASHHYSLTPRRAPPEGYDVLWRVDTGPSAQVGTARLAGGQLAILTGAVRSGERMSVAADVLLPGALVAHLRAAARDGHPGPHRRMLDLATLSVASIRPRPCVSDQAIAGLQCVQLDAGPTATRHERWYFDAAGAIARVERQLAGLPLALVACDADCDSPVTKPFDAIGHLAVASPVRIPREMAQRELRFVLSRKDGRQPAVPATGDQRVAYADSRAIVSVCRQCGDAPAPEAAELARYLRPNAWVQSDALIVRRLAARAGSPKQSVDARMRRSVALLAEAVRAETGYITYTDAAQTLRLRRADCTGFAVTLAALARAQGIPARVVVGMAYSDRFSGRRDVFSPHAWTQAWDGARWVSYDAALLDFDSTHIALAVGAGDPAEVSGAFLQLPQLRMERAGAVRPD